MKQIIQLEAFKKNQGDIAMKDGKKTTQSLKELARDWGIDYQAFKIKSELIDVIRSSCEREGISQRKLASMVPGLSQDRVCKIFSGQVGHMTIDKLIAIASALDIRVTMKAA